MDALDETLDALVADGTLERSQADAVAAALRTRPRRRVSPLVEAAGYLGAALATASAVAVAGEFFDRLEPWAFSVLLAVVAAALLAGGAWIHESDGDPVASRLAGFLWLLATAAAGGAVVTLLGGQLAWDARDVVLPLGLLVGALAVVLWRVRPGALQLLAVLAAALATTTGVVLLVDRTGATAVAVVLWATGLAWLLLTWGRLLLPVRAATAMGAAVLAVSPQVLEVAEPGWGSGLGLVTAVGLLAVSAVASQPVLVGLGAAALAAYVPQALGRAFPDAVTVPVMLLLAGLLLLGGALVLIRSRRDEG